MRRYWLIFVTTVEPSGEIRRHKIVTTDSGGLSIQEAIATSWACIDQMRSRIGPSDRIREVAIVEDTPDLQRAAAIRGKED
jgi:hypothetical protein